MRLFQSCFELPTNEQQPNPAMTNVKERLWQPCVATRLLLTLLSALIYWHQSWEDDKAIGDLLCILFGETFCRNRRSIDDHRLDCFHTNKQRKKEKSIFSFSVVFYFWPLVCLICLLFSFLNHSFSFSFFSRSQSVDLISCVSYTFCQSPVSPIFLQLP